MDTGLHSTDGGDSIDMKGTIYVSTSKGSNVFYYNPVYQTATGEVYLMSGQGMSHGGELSTGMSSSHALKEEQTITIDGKNETISSNIEVSTCFMDTPLSTTILQYDEDGNIVAKENYAAGNLPFKITIFSLPCPIIAPHGPTARESTVLTIVVITSIVTAKILLCKQMKVPTL